MGSKFLSGSGSSGGDLTELTTGTFNLNVASATVGDLVTDGVVRSANRKLTSGLVDESDLSFSVLKNPLADTLVAEDIRTTGPGSVISLNSTLSVLANRVNNLELAQPDQSLNVGDAPEFAGLTLDGPLAVSGAPTSANTDVSDPTTLLTRDQVDARIAAAPPQNPFDQSLSTSDSPQFAGLTVTGVPSSTNTNTSAGTTLLTKDQTTTLVDAAIAAIPADPAVTLTSAGGDQSLVADGTGPALQVKGLSAGANTEIVAAGGGGGALTIQSADNVVYGSVQTGGLSVSGVPTSSNADVSDPTTLLTRDQVDARIAAAPPQNPFDQSLSTTDSPSFAGLTVDGEKPGLEPDYAAWDPASGDGLGVLSEGGSRIDIQFGGTKRYTTKSVLVGPQQSGSFKFILGTPRKADVGVGLTIDTESGGPPSAVLSTFCGQVNNTFYVGGNPVSGGNLPWGDGLTEVELRVVDDTFQFFVGGLPQFSAFPLPAGAYRICFYCDDPSNIDTAFMRITEAVGAESLLNRSQIDARIAAQPSIAIQYGGNLGGANTQNALGVSQTAAGASFGVLDQRGLATIPCPGALVLAYQKQKTIDVALRVVNEANFTLGSFTLPGTSGVLDTGLAVSVGDQIGIRHLPPASEAPGNVGIIAFIRPQGSPVQASAQTAAAARQGGPTLESRLDALEVAVAALTVGT